jgi:epoxide hydrolase-like predicted phosphatase
MKVLIFDFFGVLVVRQREFSNMLEIFENRWILNEKLLNFIREERQNGSKIAVLSNVAQYSFNQFFSEEEQAELFDEVVLSGNEGVSKPDARIFEIACERLGENPENCVFVDDSPENVIVAKNLGMRGIVYADFEEFEKEMEKF